MANGQMHRGAGLLLAIVLTSALGCGSVGENNTNARPKQTLQTKDATRGTKYLQNRQKSLVQHVTDQGAAAATAAPAYGPKYLHDQGKSQARPVPAQATVTSASKIAWGTHHVHDRGISKVKQPAAPAGMKVKQLKVKPLKAKKLKNKKLKEGKSIDVVQAAQEQEHQAKKTAGAVTKWWNSQPQTGQVN